MLAGSRVSMMRHAVMSAETMVLVFTLPLTGGGIRFMHVLLLDGFTLNPTCRHMRNESETGNNGYG